MTMTPDLAAELKAIAYKMIAIANGETASGTEPPAIPEGMVAVRPTGVAGHGKVRLWPAPIAGDTPFSYFWRVARITNPASGKPYLDPTNVSKAIGANYAPGFSVAELADAEEYPGDWRTQAQIDKIAADLRGWSEWERVKQGGDGQPIYLGGADGNGGGGGGDRSAGHTGHSGSGGL